MSATAEAAYDACYNPLVADTDVAKRVLMATLDVGDKVNSFEIDAHLIDT